MRAIKDLQIKKKFVHIYIIFDIHTHFHISRTIPKMRKKKYVLRKNKNIYSPAHLVLLRDLKEPPLEWSGFWWSLAHNKTQKQK